MHEGKQDPEMGQREQISWYVYTRGLGNEQLQM